MADDPLERLLEARVEALGYELVELERTGSRSRPILRLRIDRPDSERGRGVTLDDCARVSRELESLLDQMAELGARYVLEVSSPGIERPLVRPRDFERFAGREVAIKGVAPLAGRGRRLEGTLLGLSDGGMWVRLQLADGEVVELARGEIARAHLIFRWGHAR
ncbi:MAG: ribosome maturation factor RimP [Gemmatimonadetes bacterium]|nr:ribosome maturation factor RimP [Gemmatimonadota bacterium]